MDSPLNEFGSFYIFPESIEYDLDDRSLSVWVACARASDEVYRAKHYPNDPVSNQIEKIKDGARQIITDETSKRYLIHFDHVLFYLVCEEFDYDCGKEKSDDNGVVSKVTESPLLTHLKNDTEIFWHGREVMLYRVATASEWVRVVSAEPPTITEVLDAT